MPRNRKGHGTLKSLIWNPTPDSSPLPKPVAEFARFVNEQARHYTEQFSDNEKKFIPFPVLREYWTRARIHQVQRCCSPPFSLNIDSIREKYLRTFSTLVYCNYVTSIGEFTSYNLNDDRLPLESRPEQWPRAPGHDHLFDAVSEHQWLFFPLIFTDLEDRCLNARYVLPILAVSNIPHGRDEVIIRKITIHDSCNLLLPQVFTVLYYILHNKTLFIDLRSLSFD
ncbi:hypothetical protein GGR54DRAFT_94442 [Hypoxylon sp. NC1633]|nr:hypothetical protein GGR54DRAFT_94442 [Hypoxylon sp. NC1633]